MPVCLWCACRLQSASANVSPNSLLGHLTGWFGETLGSSSSLWFCWIQTQAIFYTINTCNIIKTIGYTLNTVCSHRSRVSHSWKTSTTSWMQAMYPTSMGSTSRSRSSQPWSPLCRTQACSQPRPTSSPLTPRGFATICTLSSPWGQSDGVISG